jgi:hypothetical protein
MPAAGARGTRPPRLVVLTAGHLVDAPGRSPPRFPAELVPAVTSRIEAVFEDWSVGEGDLVLSGGARGADILFAERALDRGAEVRLLLALPPAEFVERSVAAPDGRWEERFNRLLARCPTDVLPGWWREAGLNPFEQVNTWMLEVGLRLCPPARLVAMLVWDELPGDGRGGTAGMAALLRDHGVSTVVVNPLTLADP